jgi:23S rRNA G2069 N7-methylase RlmK/C1962 C5-methylase RlmI
VARAHPYRSRIVAFGAFYLDHFSQREKFDQRIVFDALVLDCYSYDGRF